MTDKINELAEEIFKKYHPDEPFYHEDLLSMEAYAAAKEDKPITQDIEKLAEELYPHSPDAIVNLDNDSKRYHFKRGYNLGYTAAKDKGVAIDDLEARFIVRYAGKIRNDEGLGNPELRKDIFNFFKPYLKEDKGVGMNVLGYDNPFPLTDVLKRLADAAEILLHKKDYDGGDYEEIEICVQRAKNIIATLSKGIPETNQSK